MEGHIKTYHPTRKVLTGPQWLFDLYKGFKNDKGTAIIQPIIDPDGVPIIGTSILNSQDFDVDITIINPTTNQPTTPRAEIWEIPHCYYEEIIE